MNENKRKCWGCVKYKAFYTKGNSYFDKMDAGYCQYHNKIVAKQDSCEHWGHNYVTKYNRKRVMLDRLDDVLHRLIVIEQTLKDEMSDDELNWNEIK